MLRRNARRAALAVAVAALAGAAAPAVTQAQTAPLPPCTSTIGYDASIPTWQQFWAANPDPDAVVPLGWGSTGSGGGANANGSGNPGPTGRNLSRIIDSYWDGLVAATANNPRVRLIKKPVGKTATGLRDIQFYVLATPKNMTNLEDDAAFWRGVRSGEISEEVGLEAAATKPAFAWITATPHGGESAAAESITRQVYELLARTDCENERRLKLLDYFLQPVRNPDGRDAIQRTSAWGFDPNRDFGTWNQVENRLFVPQMNTYPGVFFIDAHQTSSGYFFPPNEDPVHHEISHFALDFIQHGIGPALQDAFNAQSIAFRNYSQYDLFTPEYGDTVPALIMGAAGMTYEKGTSEAYAKQVYDHYLAIDTTIKATVQDKTAITTGWVEQWKEAVDQGANCALQKNTLVSPLHDTLKQDPADDYTVCGYFFKPDQHTGDLAALVENLQRVGVRIFRLDTPVAVNGYHEYGEGNGGNTKPTSRDGVTLPAGTFYIPMEQGMKHWIQAVLGENPFIPYDYYYDVVTWSYPLQRGLAGSGFLTQKLAPGIQMTEVAANTKYGTAPTENFPVYAFNTDSARGLALAIDLLDKGVNVYRGVQPFTQGGKRFYTGAALVDAASLAGAGIDLTALAALADARDTPVSGLTGYPVQRRQLSVPKIGVYTNSPFIPTNPNYISGANVAGNSGHCALSGLPSAQSPSSYCETMHALSVKLGLPASTSTKTGRFMPVTSADIEAGKLVSENFTALINPNGTIATTAGTPPAITPTGTALKAFINGGGTYVGINANGVNAARTISAATLDTSPSSEYPNMLTPGATFDATFDTANPVAWGFDLGGWIYRDSNGNPVFNAATVGTGTSVVKYKATADEKYGYEANATPLWNRPAVVEQPYGSGRSVLFGFNPFYRSWKEQDERLVLNAVLFPKGGVVAGAAPTPDTAAPAPQAAAIEPVAAPVKGQSAAGAVRAPVTKVHATDRDVRIKVKRRDGAKLKSAVRAANLSTKVKRSLRYSTTKSSVTLIVKNARTSNEHTRKDWVSRVVSGLDRRKVTPISALV